MHYSEDPDMVRVDFFKSSGKWYTTEAVKWTGGYFMKEQSPHQGFKKSLVDHFLSGGFPNRLCEMDAICLEPYHEFGYPLQLKSGAWLE